MRVLQLECCKNIVKLDWIFVEFENVFIDFVIKVLSIKYFVVRDIVADKNCYSSWIILSDPWPFIAVL